jgi:hypothetical protein
MKGHMYPKSENFVGSEGNKMSGADIGAIISGTGEAVGAIIGALGTVKDIKLRREYEIRISELDRQEKKDLNDKLLRANTDNDKRKILADVLTSTSIARIKAFSKKDVNLMIYLIGGVLVLGASYYIYKKMKK